MQISMALYSNLPVAVSVQVEALLILICLSIYLNIQIYLWLVVTAQPATLIYLRVEGLGMLPQFPLFYVSFVKIFFPINFVFLRPCFRVYISQLSAEFAMRCSAANVSIAQRIFFNMKCSYNISAVNILHNIFPQFSAISSDIFTSLSLVCPLTTKSWSTCPVLQLYMWLTM